MAKRPVVYDAALESILYTDGAPMNVLALNGSPHKKGNTFQALSAVATGLKAEGIKTEIAHLGSGSSGYGPCTVCLKCTKKQDGRCHGVKDKLNDLIEKMANADGLLLGSPVWFSAATPYIKNVLDRAGFVSRQAKKPLFTRKPGASVVVARRAGANTVFSELNYWLTIHEMIVVGSSYWNVGFSGVANDVGKDEEAMAVYKTLGTNLAWAMERLSK